MLERSSSSCEKEEGGSVGVAGVAERAGIGVVNIEKGEEIK